MSLQALQRKVDEFIEEAKANPDQTKLDEFDGYVAGRWEFSH